MKRFWWWEEFIWFCLILNNSDTWPTLYKKSDNGINLLLFTFTNLRVFCYVCIFRMVKPRQISVIMVGDTGGKSWGNWYIFKFRSIRDDETRSPYSECCKGFTICVDRVSHIELYFLPNLLTPFMTLKSLSTKRLP